jgi:hypothetical protein
VTALKEIISYSIIEMPLTSHDFKRIIDTPVNKTLLTFADYDNDRMSFHAKRATSFADVSAYYTLFKKKVDSILIPAKRKPFWDLFEYPLPTNEVISDASDELNKVFTAKDAVLEINCSDNDLKEDFITRLDGVRQFVMNDIFNAVFERCNSIVLVDLPREQLSEFPEPYPMILEAKEIFDISYKIDNSIGYVCIKKDDNFYYFVDEQAYYLIEYDGSSIKETSVFNHSLGFCPAFDIWKDRISKDGIRKLSPIIDILALLDNYVFKYIQKNFLDLYADNPILEKYEESCHNPDCVNGYVIKEEKNEKCPDCSNRAFIGAGSILTKPVPTGIEANIETAAKWIAVPVDSLEYTKSKLEANYKRIYEFLTGYVKGGEKTEAINQDQVYSQLESRKAKLSWWAENLERVHKSIIDTMGKLRYGNGFIDSTVHYGRDFHLWTLDTALKELESAQKIGLPVYLTSILRENVALLIVGSSSYKAKRVAILMLLEPYPDVALNFVPKDTIDFEIKANFTGYINRFETKYGDIVNFASLLDIYTKIEKIKTVLTAFAIESQKKQIETRKMFLEVANVQQLNNKENG